MDAHLSLTYLLLTYLLLPERGRTLLSTRDLLRRGGVQAARASGVVGICRVDRENESPVMRDACLICLALFQISGAERCVALFSFLSCSTNHHSNNAPRKSWPATPPAFIARIPWCLSRLGHAYARSVTVDF